ncbi:serine/threonine protein kinase [Gigaspora margarita]|uniref:Serine/threonine protein kinase n=1 Tax=Gigaspora margarita TaxID=4874 RepID=A0A8H3XP32_GIGMA|nr:serine/threonine protein kinase [Gigaspora margarita]
MYILIGIGHTKKWGLFTWEEFYDDKYPNKSKEEACDSFRCDLDVLINELKPKTSKYNKALALKGDLLNLKKRKRPNEKGNSIQHEISTGTSLSDIIKNSLPNLKYLQLRPEKCSSSIKSYNHGTWSPRMYIKKPTFSSRTITCEKDMWTAAEINTHDVLTPLDRSSINMLGFKSINQIYGYMCANKLRYGICQRSTKRFFLKEM